VDQNVEEQQAHKAESLLLGIPRWRTIIAM
jgi:hypothetical protein